MSVRTAEAACIGHPDKLCDLIAETLLDRVLFRDASARCAFEVSASGRIITVMGEVTTTAKLRIREWTRQALTRTGYNPLGFVVRVNLRLQSPDIAGVVSTSMEATDGDDSAHVRLGAGDQGTVYGYATDENYEMLPTPLAIAQDICKRLDTARMEGTITGINSDGKAQVSVAYDDAGQPVSVEAVVVSIQHDKAKNLKDLRQEVTSVIINPALKDLPLGEGAVVLVNPAVQWTLGGPKADVGLTGRKLAVDTYGGLAPHGGGAFAGKDPSKVDKSAALMARRIAKTIVRSGLAREVVVSVSYAIGRAEPVAFQVDTRGTGSLPDNAITQAARQVFSLRPSAMIEILRLRMPFWAESATYGYFRPTLSASWERECYSEAQALKEVATKHAHSDSAHQ